MFLPLTNATTATAQKYPFARTSRSPFPLPLSIISGSQVNDGLDLLVCRCEHQAQVGHAAFIHERVEADYYTSADDNESRPSLTGKADYQNGGLIRQVGVRFEHQRHAWFGVKTRIDCLYRVSWQKRRKTHTSRE